MAEPTHHPRYPTRQERSWRAINLSTGCNMRPLRKVPARVSRDANLSNQCVPGQQLLFPSVAD